MKKRKIIRIVSRICFTLYMLCLVYFLLLSDGFGRVEGYREYRYNIIPFQEISRFIKFREYIDFISVVVNLLGNVFAFMPFGALIRWVLNRKIRWYQAVGYTFLFSLSVELLQLVAKVGVFDVDDLFLNTLGGLVGFWIYYILLLLNRRSERSMKESAYKVKNYSIDAVISCIIGSISLCLILIAVIMSYVYDGKGPAMVGLLGIGSLLLSLVGIVFTISSWSSVDGGLLMKRVSGILNGIAIFIAVVFYVLGWVL